MHMELVAARLDGESSAQKVGRFFEPVEIFDRKREIVESVGIAGIELQRLPVNRLRLLGPLQFAQAGAEIVPAIGEARLQSSERR